LQICYCFPGEDEEEGYFGQQQVPLTDEIREILEEYPDGQIFKVSWMPKCNIILWLNNGHKCLALYKHEPEGKCIDKRQNTSALIKGRTQVPVVYSPSI